MQGYLYIGGQQALPTTVVNSSNNVITATNTTGSAISANDKVWVETESKNFTVVGSPTIVNKVVSNFSNSNYLQVSPMANTTSGTWTFDVEFTYVTNPYPPEASDPQSIVYFTDSNNDDRGVAIIEGILGGTIPSTNSDGYEYLESSTVLTSGETYQLQIELTANSGKFYIKHNGSIIETLSGQNGTYMPASITGFNLGGTGHYDRFVGSINLNNTNIKINNSTAWSPYSPAQPYYLINFADVSSSTITGFAAENIAIGGTGDVEIGEVIEPTLGTKTITVNGTYNASSDNLDGFSSVTVDVPGIPREVSAQGVYQMPTSSFTFSLPSNATDVGDHGLAYAFYGCTRLTSADLSSLITVSSDDGLYNTFAGCTALTSVDLSSLTTVSGLNGLFNAFHGCTGLTSVDLSALTTVSGSYGLNYAFYGCTGLTSIDLSALTTVSGEAGLYYAFQNCTGLTSVSFPSLTTVSGNGGLSSAFYGCTGLTSVNFSNLTEISGSSAMRYAFEGCTALTDIYFRALTTTSFGSNTNQFNNMLQNTGTTTTHTLHFPSNMQSTISGLTGYPNFGGTSGYVTCLFDLPATS